MPVRPTVVRDASTAGEHSLTPTFTDIDGDGDTDILLAGDFRASQVLRNEAGAALTHLYHAPTQFLATSYGYDILNRRVALQLRARG